MDANDIIADGYFSCTSEDEFFSAGSDDSDYSLHDTLTNVFSPFPKQFNVVHINAQSVPAHHSDLLVSFDSNTVDAILISESFLKPSLPPNLFTLPGFNLIRNDRVGKGGGGVAIYLRHDFSYKIINTSPSQYSESAEYLFIEVTVNFTKLLLAVFYCPSLHINYFPILDNLLYQLCPIYDHILLLGDFNTCLLKQDSRANKLNSILSSFNLNSLSLSATHHFPNTNPSLLDLIIVSRLDSVNTYGQLPSCFSYHDLIYISYKIRVPKVKASYTCRRSFNRIDVAALRNDFGAIDWTPIFRGNNVDTMVKFFNKSILNLFDHHAPVKKIKIKHKPAPWVNSDIKIVMSKRDKAKRIFNRVPSDYNLSNYKCLRNLCNRLCRIAKRRYIHESITNAGSDKVWRFLKSLGIGKVSSSCADTTDVNALNSFFTTPPLVLNNSIKLTTISSISSTSFPQCPPFFLQPVTDVEVQRHIASISSLAMGSDNICSRMIGLLLPDALPIISNILNFSLSSGVFPSDWKLGHIIPLPKVLNPVTLSQYRPISILPYLSKVLEHIVHGQLMQHVVNNKLLNPFQSAFRPGHSTITSLIRVTDDIRLAMDGGQLTIIVFLDFSNAFNSTDYDILLEILKSLRIGSLEWFRSYLIGRSQRTCLKDLRSVWNNLLAGVPQGGVLSPLLFSFFINTVSAIISSKFHLYADDLQLYRHCSVLDVTRAVNEINLDLQRINSWAQSYGLLINPSKSQAMIIGSRYMRNQLTHIPTIFYNNTPIPLSHTVKNLGLVFSADFSWESHISSISKKVHYTLHSLKSLQNFLPLQTKITLMVALILPIIDYADSCYPDATEEQLNKLERIQNLCIRFIFGLRKYDHVSQYRARLKWLPIRLRRNTHILCLLYNILFCPLTPYYLKERFEFIHPPGSPCRPSVSFLLRVPMHKSSTFTYSFTVSAIKLWNSLPNHIRNSTSLCSFKNKLKQYYLSCSHNK